MGESELELIVRYLKYETTPQENEILQEWLKMEANRLEFEKLKKIWNASGKIYSSYSPDLIEARARIQAGIDAPVKLNPWKMAARVAAILAIVFGLSWSAREYFDPKPDSLTSIHSFTTGAYTDSLMLGDGTMVWLNQETTLKYPENFVGTERRVTLTGEAFFKVAHNPEKPFLVEAEGTITKVLGTSFNIRTDANNVSISVLSGKVSYSENGNPKNFQLLTKHEKAEFNYSDRSILKSPFDKLNVLAWKNNLLVFTDTPLVEVAKTLSEYYRTPVFLDPTLSEYLPLTSSFEDQSLKEVLEVISLTLDLRVEKESDGYMLSSIKK